MPGLTCVQMIIRWLRDDNGYNDLSPGISNEGDGNSISNHRDSHTNIEKEWMMEYVATTSIWTIDLIFLLEYIFFGTSLSQKEKECIHAREQQRPEQSWPAFALHPMRKASYLFCSTQFEVDESYNTFGYYKDKFSDDEIRVKKMFNVAREKNLPLLQTRHISLGSLVDIVCRKDIVAIALVDNRILLNNPFHADTENQSYSGHYVVLCGVSHDEDELEYARMRLTEEDRASDNYDYVMIVKNPGLWKDTEFVHPAMFEKAWRANGTDEDIIFLAKHDR